ncbi:hypothetical protein [Kitasatospora herbaricolor]|uniref:hypothetical protein n=1 Tax=Kitasatospora herbaricolor TaxID=68217 RepID=UPI0036DF9806
MSAASDRRRLAAIAEQASIPYIEHLNGWDWACNQARRLLAPQWSAVDALALQLLQAPGGILDEHAIEKLASVFAVA